jgi:ABC-type branched-subunit amino acid transport system substrate-binding protein
MDRRQLAAWMVGLAAATIAMPSFAQKKYDAGATDKEIKIGGISPYSGPASAYGTIGKGIKAYFDKVNAEGGVNGRKLVWVSYDDGYNPAKTVEMARKLVEQDEVLLVFNVLGTPTNSAIHKYMNQKKVPQLFNATGATKWGDPTGNPWTMGWQPSYQSEARIYAQHILDTKPNAKIGIIYQNDDYGRDYLKGFEDGLGEKAKTMIIKKLSYEATDPTIDSQMVELKTSGADTFFNITIPKFAAQAIKKAADIGWKPTHYLNGVSASVASVIIPAGPQNAVDVITAYYLKDPTDTQWQTTKEYKDWLEWMQKYFKDGDLKDANNVFAYSVAQTMVEVLKKAGDNLTRDNVMKQAANLDLTLPMLLTGVNVKTGPDDFFPIERQQLQKWDGKNWIRFGKIYGR